ncbi:MAG TPA: acyl-CoA dehydrogenase family protein [Gaiella sp.]|nr:acyl-CoA dehydrogenase family protein [Gaiella sp.]
MSIELRATTPAGESFVALAEALAEELAALAPEHDRAGTFPFESFEAVKRSGYLTAPIPEGLGGLGVTSVHDLVVGASRLARGDASLAIGINMHLVYVSNVARRLQRAIRAGNERRAAALSAVLGEIANEGLAMSAAISEPQQDLMRPSTTATATDDGWLVSGRKVFCTMSPAADVLYVSVTYANGDGGERYGYALVPRDTPGVVVHDDWDALGMRSSGSNSVTFDEVSVPRSALTGGFPIGQMDGYLDRNLAAGLFHAAVSLGIAEQAHSVATGRLAGAPFEPDARSRTIAAESVLDLTACRAVLSRAGTLVDEQADDENLLPLFAEVQAAKTFVGEAAVRVVDRALSLSGGGGYLNGSPLARAYRDVRASAFMHPLGANRAYEFLADVALGREPSLR